MDLLFGSAQGSGQDCASHGEQRGKQCEISVAAGCKRIIPLLGKVPPSELQSYLD